MDCSWIGVEWGVTDGLECGRLRIGYAGAAAGAALLGSGRSFVLFVFAMCFVATTLFWACLGFIDAVQFKVH